MKERSILVIDDDRDLSELLLVHLSDMGWKGTALHNGHDGLAEVLANNFDLVILDLNLTGVGGLEICEKIRRAGKSCLIVMLTCRSSEIDRVIGLELGADDYLAKPFSFRELQARIKGLFRRDEKEAPQRTLPDTTKIEHGDLAILIGKRRATMEGATLDLTAKEFDLLVYLAQRPGHVFSRAHLLGALWGASFTGYEHTVNSHMNRLRAKIEANPAEPKFILTVRGAGYKFKGVEETEESARQFSQSIGK